MGGGHVPCWVWGLVVMYVAAVNAVPSIVIPPQNTTVKVRGTVILMCQVEDNEGYTVSWIKSDKVISNDYDIVSSAVESTRYSIVGEPSRGNYSLKITGVLTLDSGLFACQVGSLSSSNGAISGLVDLIVQYPPGEAYPQCLPNYLDTTGLVVGQRVDFGCFTQRGEPAARLNWTLDGAEVPSEMDESTGVEIIGLKFSRNVTVEDNGRTFVCTLTHELLMGPTTCLVGPLDVIFPPMVTISTGHPTPKVGTRFFLLCSAEANPLRGLTYSWYALPPSDGQRESQAKPINVTNSYLILDVKREDDGTVFVCEAKNDIGAMNATFTLSIFQPTTTDAVPSTPPAARPTIDNPSATFETSVGDLLTAPYVIILILIAVSMLLLAVALVIFALKRKKRSPSAAVITITDLDNIHADIHSLASFGNISRQGTPYLDRVDYELNRSRSHSRDAFDNVSLDSASALVTTRSHSQNSPTHRKYSVDSLGKPLTHSTPHYREHRRPSNGSPTHGPAKWLDSYPTKERKASESAISQAGRPLPKINGPVQQNEYAELTPVSARKQYNESQVSVTSPESGFGEDNILIKPLNDSFPPHPHSSNNCNCGRKVSHVEV